MGIYDEIGGAPTMKAAVAVFYDRVIADPLVAPYFEGVDMQRLMSHQRAFLTAAFDGPDFFAGRGMGEAHARIGVTVEAFDATVEHLTLALLDIGVPAPVVDTIRGRLEAHRSAIVSAPVAPGAR